MADLLHIFVELADEQVLKEKIKPALYDHYCQLVERYPLIHMVDPLLKKGVNKIEAFQHSEKYKSF